MLRMIPRHTTSCAEHIALLSGCDHAPPSCAVHRFQRQYLVCIEYVVLICHLYVVAQMCLCSRIDLALRLKTGRSNYASPDLMTCVTLDLFEHRNACTGSSTCCSEEREQHARTEQTNTMHKCNQEVTLSSFGHLNFYLLFRRWDLLPKPIL